MKPLSLLVAWFFFYPPLLWAQQPARIYTVYFASGSAGLDAAAKRTIAHFAAAYRSAGGQGTLSLYGYADAVGQENDNQQLSEKRLRSVLAYLEKQRILKKAIKRAEAYGEQDAAANGSGAVPVQENRRVDIVWTTHTWAKEVKADTLPDPVALFSPDTLNVGATVRLPHINFYIASATFTPASQPALDQLLALMRNHPALVIEIQGHTCCPTKAADGSHILVPTDLKLSENRARAVYDFLVTQGIDKARVHYKGFSNSQPLVYPERSEADRKVNRRVEIKVLAK